MLLTSVFLNTKRPPYRLFDDTAFTVLQYRGPPLEDYAGTVVHDHGKTFYIYGTGHQEYTQHDIRYLTGSIQNEPELTWNRQMLSLLR